MHPRNKAFIFVWSAVAAILVLFGAVWPVPEIVSALVWMLWVFTAAAWIVLLAFLGEDYQTRFRERTDLPPVSAGKLGTALLLSLALAATGHYALATAYFLAHAVMLGVRAHLRPDDFKDAPRR